MRFEGSPAESMSSDKQKVMHSNFFVDGNLLFMASDTGNEGNKANDSGIVHLSLNFNDPGKMQNVLYEVVNLSETLELKTFEFLILNFDLV